MRIIRVRVRSYNAKLLQEGSKDMVYTIDELRAVIIGLLRKYGANHAILFGSYARQEADAASDIDLVVIGGT